MKALITGVSGFVGSHLAEHLLANGDWSVAGTVYGPFDNIEGILPELEIYPAELSRLPVVEFVLDRAHPDVIFHLAAIAVTGQSWRDPAGTLQTNVAMQANILQAVINLRLECRIIVVSSSEVYGAVSPDMLPIAEETPFRPLNPYAVSKVAQDMLGLQYHLSHRLDTVRLRPFNHIGARQSPGFVAPDFASQIARIEAGLEEPVLRVGNLGARRDFTDVHDVVRAYRLAALCGESGQVYNVGSGRSYTIQHVLDTFLAQSKTTIQIEPDPVRMRPSDIPEVICDYSRLHARTGWQPRIPLDQSLTDVLAYWRARVSE